MFTPTRLLGNNRSGSPLASPSWCTRAVSRRHVNKYCWAAGIDPDRRRQHGIGIHSLCKTPIKDAVRNGAPMHEVGQLAGHSQIRTPERCLERNEEDREVAARQIPIRVPEREAGDNCMRWISQYQSHPPPDTACVLY
jgi:hypothetical protein